MNASKENAQKALEALDKLNCGVDMDIDGIQKAFVYQSLKACEKNLPRERTYEEAKKRDRKGKSSRKSGMITLEDVSDL